MKDRFIESLNKVKCLIEYNTWSVITSFLERLHQDQVSEINHIFHVE